jgi:hypothetical protein
MKRAWIIYVIIYAPFVDWLAIEIIRHRFGRETLAIGEWITNVLGAIAVAWAILGTLLLLLFWYQGRRARKQMVQMNSKTFLE